MTRRGPEHGVIYTNGSIGFGHRRLKIIDLSDASNQPFVDEHLGLSLVFNGAIYNYKVLRERLIQEGYAFSSKGDTETILKAYYFWGQACVEKFNGMFAFVVYDCRNNTVFMARDRLGIKPLYYHKTHRRLLFASSLPALFEADSIKKEISPRALHYYMHFHAVDTQPVSWGQVEVRVDARGCSALIGSRDDSSFRLKTARGLPSVIHHQ